MATRTWGGITLPSSAFTIMFAYKVSGDGTYNVITHEDLTVDLVVAGGATTLELNGLTSILLGDINNYSGWALLFIVLDGTDVSVYVNDSIVPITDTLAGYSSTGAFNMAVGSTGLSLSNFRIVGVAIDISSYDTNYVFNDIQNNNGNIYFEVS